MPFVAVFIEEKKMYPEAVKKLTEDELTSHPKYLVLMALHNASVSEAEFFLRCFIKVSKEGFLKAPDNDYAWGNPHSVLFKEKMVRVPDMRCLIPRKNRNYVSVRVFTDRYTDTSGTWLGFSPESAEGIKELLGEKFSPVNLFGDEK